jgi:tRNA threonylcarbamoyl adenosine modification protein YeaZ
VERLLKKSGCRLKELDALAVSSGPGSFTGIRVGMTFVSMLAQSLQKPAAAVSLLEAEANRAWRSLKAKKVDGIGIVYPAVRDELYFQIFKRDLKPLGEPLWILPHAWPKTFVDMCQGRRIALAGPAARIASKHLKSTKAPVEVWQGRPLGADELIEPALKKLAVGSTELSPLYLKPAYYERATASAAN